MAFYELEAVRNPGFVVVHGRPTESAEKRNLAVAGARAMALLVRHAVSSALGKHAVQSKR